MDSPSTAAPFEPIKLQALFTEPQHMALVLGVGFELRDDVLVCGCCGVGYALTHHVDQTADNILTDAVYARQVNPLARERGCTYALNYKEWIRREYEQLCDPRAVIH